MLAIEKALERISKDMKQYRKGKIATSVANTRARQLQVYSNLLWLKLRDEKSIDRITS